MQSTAEGTFLTQTFERNRFEPHPEKARPYDVLLGRLGAERLAQLGRNWQAEPRGGTSTRLSMICANRWRRGPIAGAVPRKMLPQYVSSSFGHTPEQSTQATAVSLEARSA
jgi:hypothetical protein